MNERCVLVGGDVSVADVEAALRTLEQSSNVLDDVLVNVYPHRVLPEYTVTVALHEPGAPAAQQPVVDHLAATLAVPVVTEETAAEQTAGHAGSRLLDAS